MKIKLISTICILTTFILCSPSLHALKPRSKYFKSEEDANHYLTKHYNLGCEYYNCQDWRAASSEFEKIIFYFPCSDAAAEASYYLAVCYFEMKEYDFANEEFSNYLKASQHPAFFEEAVRYKFCIAEHFKGGKKRRPFKMRYLPKWVSGQESALVIYDEVVAALPNHELAIQALYSKADLLKKMREYRDAVETYQTIIRRFPKDEIVPACYLNIADAYVQQSRIEFQNPDILALAELNVRKFRDDFPRDERVAIAEESVCHIKEMYAKGLCDLGLFYERMQKPDAAAIYFQSSIEEFPDTRVAKFCRLRLISLGYIEEEPAPCLDEAVPPPLCDVRYEEAEVPVYSEPSFSSEAPVYSEVPPPPPQVQEYVHYSLIKKREMQECHCEQPQMSEVIEGDLPPCPENAHQEEQPLELWHYSVIKHRDQYVPCQD
jgi:outer membrane protein assembly factor BamD (BamD/ComL family)